MRIHRLDQAPPAALASALASFEAQFTYPLGPGRSFSISHGMDYPLFFRAIGRAACFVAEDDGRVLGTLAVVIRRLAMPDGRDRPVAYLADLKVAPEARRGRVLFRLADAARAWARAWADAAFSTVMDGTRTTPLSYTGRVGIPAFEVLAKVLVLRIPVVDGPSAARGDWLDDPTGGESCYRALSLGRYATIGGQPRDRSELNPQWLVDPRGMACGLLEDTRRGKRLVDAEGSELVSAHLSYFAFRTAGSAIDLLREARRRGADHQVPAIFAAVSEADGPEILRRLGDIGVVVAPATVYGTNLDPGVPWNVNTAEI